VATPRAASRSFATRGRDFSSTTKARHLVVDEAASHAKQRLVVQHVAGAFERCSGLVRKASAAGEARSPPAAISVYVEHVQNQFDRVAVHDVPRVPPKLVFDLRDEARPADKRQALLAPEHDAQHLVEADEVVHVGVADEGMRHAQQLARRQHRDVAEIE